MKRLIPYLVALLPCAVHAQPALTLDDCIRLARENNKRITAAEYRLQAALQEQRSTRALLAPSFSLTGSVLYSTADGSYSSGPGQLPVLGADGVPTGQTAFFPGIGLQYELGWILGGGIKVEQPLYMGGKIRTGYRMTRIGSELARQNRRLTEAEVIVETSRAFAEVVRTGELRRVAASYHDLLQELMRTVERARRHGMKSQNDVLKVQVKLNESELNLRRAENGHRLATMNLCHYIGRPLTEHPTIDDRLPEFGPAPAHHDGIENRPEYRMLDQQSELARERIAAARSERLPQIGLIGQYGYLNGIELNERKLFDGWNFLVGVQVSVPIFHFGQRSAKLHAAQAQYAQIEAERADTDERMTLEMTRAFNDLDEAQLEERLAESSVVSAEENLRTSRLQYEQGVETLSDHLEAQVLWQQAQQTRVDARINRYLKWLEYRKATGQIN